MYIHRLSLRNIRGFESLDFDLARPDGGYAGWTVFTGDNGSGKSTLLKAIAVALLERGTARSLQSFHRWVRDGCGQDESSIELEIVGCESDDFFAESGRISSTNRFAAKVVLNQQERETTIQAVIPPGKPRSYRTPERSIWSPTATGWFSCGYGPFRRVFGASPDATRQMVDPTAGRFVTMFQEAASLAEVDQWLRQLHHRALEGKDSAKAQLGLVMRLLDDDLMPNGISVDRVDSEGLWLKDRNGVRLAWTEMSDGYRAAVALLADILRHLIRAFGADGLAEEGSDGKAVIARSGVVLIDEVDAHLHPEWQREIGFWLKRHFPRIQFLVATHSPLICQAADPHGLFVLPEPGSEARPRALSEEDYRTVIASRPDTILLSPAFGLENTRSPRAVEGRAEYARLQSKRRAVGRLTDSEEKRSAQLQLFAAPEADT